MLFGSHDGGVLEIRKRGGGAVVMRGRFPYGKRAVLSDGGRNGGRPKKEIIAPKAFAYRVNDPTSEIHLLIGHDYGKPLASRGAGTMALTDTAAALTFEATIPEEMQRVSYVRDALAAVSAGLMVGLSPGFRLPPQRTVAKAETITDEDPREGTAIIRTVHDALLYELSLVTVPAYKEALIEADGDLLAAVLTADQLTALKDAKSADAIKAVLAGLSPAQLGELARLTDAARAAGQIEARCWVPDDVALDSGLRATLNRWRL